MPLGSQERETSFNIDDQENPANLVLLVLFEELQQIAVAYCCTVSRILLAPGSALVPNGARYKKYYEVFLFSLPR